MVHNELISELRRQLKPQLASKYFALSETYLRIDRNPDGDRGGMYSNIKHQIPYIKIVDADSRSLITVIELISPVNKRGTAYEEFIAKRRELLGANVNFLEVDLIRRGKKVLEHTSLDAYDYYAGLYRARTSNVAVWGFNLGDALPKIAVPLERSDPNAVLHLQDALDTIYADIGLNAIIDYKSVPPPPKI